MTISEILLDKFGLAGQPGKKTDCPFCGHHTFSITHNNELGKCFHPACLRRLTPYQYNRHYKNSIYEALDGAFRDFHSELLSQKKAQFKNAYDYLLMERRVHPQVIEDSMLGAVPSGYSVELLFAPVIEALKGKLKEGEEKKGPGRPKKQSGPGLTDQLEFIEGVKEKFRKCISRRAGWLTFFYLDHLQRIVAIRFREPYTKNIVYFKPFKAAGLFGHQLFRPYTSEHLKSFNEKLIVTEGEFNQLQLQSLCQRQGKTEGMDDPGYLFACAVGGVENADLDCIKKIARQPVYCYDNDAAGLKLVENALRLMPLESFTTPEPDSDLDDYIVSFDRDHHAAWSGVKELLAGRLIEARDYKGLAEEIFHVRQKHGRDDVRKEFEISNRVACIIRTDMLDRGKFYFNDQHAYYFFSAEKRLVQIDKGDKGFRDLMSEYGIKQSEPIMKYLMDDLQDEATKRGTQSEIYHTSFYDKHKFILYFDNHRNQIHRISREAIDLVDNGTDGVLFLEDNNAQAFELEEYDYKKDSLLHRFLLDRINFAEDVFTQAELKLLFETYFYSLFFESIQPTKPILTFIGEKGSGKSLTLRKIGLILIGSKFNVENLPKDEERFDTSITNKYYIAYDNVDSKYSWLDDRLAAVATGVVITKRQLYTTNTLVTFIPRCFLAITSRNPQFRRDDVAERLLLFPTMQLIQKIGADLLIAEINDNRNKILYEIVQRLQEVVGWLKDFHSIQESGKFRMADFYRFAMKIARGRGIEDMVIGIFKKLSQEQSTFTLEEDPILDLLMEWVELEGSDDLLEPVKNSDREVTNAELCSELAALAEKNNLEFIYKNKTQGFAKRMANLRSNMESFFEISRRKIRGNRTVFKFRPKNDGEKG